MEIISLFYAGSVIGPEIGLQAADWSVSGPCPFLLQFRNKLLSCPQALTIQLTRQDSMASTDAENATDAVLAEVMEEALEHARTDGTQAAEQPEDDLDIQDDKVQTLPAGPELTGEGWGDLGSLLAPEDCEQITADGGVVKKILVEGTGEKPPKFARCLVHYIGRLQSNGNIFLDSKTESLSQQPVRVVAGRHASQTETGLYLGVESMRTGERAAIYIQDPKYGYGSKGSFSFPSVPPSEQLTYEVEMLDWEEAEDGQGDSTNLMYEDRLERAERRRLAGNKLFAEGKYKEALNKYVVGLSYLDEDFMMQLEGFYEDKANEVKLPIHLNMAACQLKLKDYHTTIYNTSEVLKYQPDNSKALYRRAVARHALGQTEDAMKDANKALELAPEDKAIVKELQAIKQSVREERAAEAKLFKGHFKFPEVTPAPPAQAADGTAGSEGQGDQTAAGLRQRKAAASDAAAVSQGSSREQPVAARGGGLLAWLFGLLIALFQRLTGRAAVRAA